MSLVGMLMMAGENTFIIHVPGPAWAQGHPEASLWPSIW